MTPIDIAINRLSELKAEMAELETFIRVYYRLYPEEKLAQVMPGGPSAAIATSVDNFVDNPVENEDEKGLHAPSQGSPGDRQRAEIAEKFKMNRAREIFGDIFERVIRAAGRPLTRGEMVQHIQALPDAPPMNSDDASKYIGTLLWRNRHRFCNLPGHGYWLIRERYEPAGYLGPKPDYLKNKDDGRLVKAGLNGLFSEDQPEEEAGPSF